MTDQHDDLRQEEEAAEQSSSETNLLSDRFSWMMFLSVSCIVRPGSERSPERLWRSGIPQSDVGATEPSRLVSIVRPLRSNTFSMGDIFREDLGDELMKSGFTAEGCEMAY